VSSSNQPLISLCHTANRDGIMVPSSSLDNNTSRTCIDSYRQLTLSVFTMT